MGTPQPLKSIAEIVRDTSAYLANNVPNDHQVGGRQAELDLQVELMLMGADGTYADAMADLVGRLTEGYATAIAGSSNPSSTGTAALITAAVTARTATRALYGL